MAVRFEVLVGVVFVDMSLEIDGWRGRYLFGMKDKGTWDIWSALGVGQRSA